MCRFPIIFGVFHNYIALGLSFSFFQVYRKMRRGVFLSRVVDVEVEKLRREFPHDERGLLVTEKDFDRVSRKIERIICLQKEVCRLNAEVKKLEARSKKVS